MSSNTILNYSCLRKGVGRVARRLGDPKVGLLGGGQSRYWSL
jgi:hypothetical protein